MRKLSGAGAMEYIAGETVFHKGAATYPESGSLFGEAQFGEPVIGGGGFSALGGFITMEGSRSHGPHLSVAQRFGADSNRIQVNLHPSANLQSVLELTSFGV